MALRGLNHITLSVRDIVESFDFYTKVLGFRPLARWPVGAYLEAGDTWIALELDSRLRAEPLPERSHIAFSVAPTDFEEVSARVRASGAIVWQENWTEGDSLYFLDPNGHKLEIHTSDLEARLRSAKEHPWPGLQFFD